LESDFAQKKLHPSDLKQSVADYLIKIISPVRDKIVLNDELFEAIKKNS
jgi:tyrosyl-tRNA synthetase